MIADGDGAGTGQGDRGVEGRRDLCWMLAIGVTGLVLRVVCARQFAANPLGRYFWTDEQAYWERAREILLGQVLPDGPFYQDPLYPYLLAGLMVVVGDGAGALRLALACLGALTPPTLFWAGRKGLGRAEGLVAGWAAAFYGPLVFTDISLEKEGVGALLAALALGLTAVAAGPGAGGGASAATSTAAGGAWGVLALLRSNAMVVGPIGAAWRYLAFPGRLADRARAALGFLAGVALPLLPVIAFNVAVSRPREFVLTTWQMGSNFYMGNGPEATGTLTEIPFVVPHPFLEAHSYVREARLRSGRWLSLGEVSRFWLGEGLKRWRRAPFASLRLLGKKVFLLANDHEIADNHFWQYTRLAGAPALAWGVLTFGWLAPFVALGLARGRGRGRGERPPFWWFLVASTAGGLAATAAFFVIGRYRIPWIPGLILIGAAGAVDLARRLAEGRFRGVAWRVVLLAAPAAAVAWAPSPQSAEERWGLALRRQVGASLLAGDADAAVDALDEVRALGPVPMIRVARVLAEGPDHDAMADLLTGRPGTGVERARLLRQLPEGRAESRRLLEAALAANPNDRAARREWGAWWLGEVDNTDARARARDELERAARGPEGDASAAVLLALLTRDPCALDLPAVRAGGNVSPARLRVARAILAEGSWVRMATQR